jgi:glycosyltransferase involved in cell wall biosynthesis
MKLACTGFVSSTAGSVASANALLLVHLLDLGFQIDFFSKPSFVDPRPIIGNKDGFRFVPVDNRALNYMRTKVERIPLVATAAGIADAYSYNRLVARTVGHEHQQRRYDLCLWLGDYARASVPGLPTVSFPQGPPGTDARSVLARFSEIRSLAGVRQALKWRMLARLRLSRFGRPPLYHTDQFIIGSRQSADTLVKLYSVDPRRISILPYPIDLDLFKSPSPSSQDGPLRVLWLGRIVPRKRLDIFLDGASLAIRRGVDLKLTVIGPLGFIPGYQLLIRSFPYQDRLTHQHQIDRLQVPNLLSEHDVLAQPSEEENFGSSVAEAQACGLPVIVGHTNGNADYLSVRDIHLADERPETFAEALAEIAQRKRTGRLGEQMISRQTAERNFHVEGVTQALIKVLKSVRQKPETSTRTATEPQHPVSEEFREHQCMIGPEDKGVTGPCRFEFRDNVLGKHPELVSVIVPAFNAANNIRQTLDSVRAQTYHAFEVIVVDDGSSDDTSAIVEEFVRKDSRFRLIRQENRGVGDARNSGIRSARGQYIAPLDADDLWFPEKLEKQVARMKQCSKETALVYCWSTFIDRNGDFLDEAYHVTVEGCLRHAIVMRNIVENASIPLFRTNVFEKVGLYLTREEQGGAQGCEDWDLAIRIAEVSSIGAVPERLVAYRLTGGSMSADAESMAASFANVIHRARQRNGDLPPTTFRWSTGNFYRYLANRCYEWGHYFLFLRYFKEAIAANPVLLLDAVTYSTLFKSVFDITASAGGFDLAPRGRVSPGRAGERVYLRRSKKSKILNIIFNHIEAKRWSAALNDQSLIGG